jgi:hypothetical protein
LPGRTDPHRPVNITRFTYLNPDAMEFWRDYDQIAHDAAPMRGSKPAAARTTPA